MAQEGQVARLNTESGADELPEGWTLATLGDVCRVNPGRPPVDALSPDALVTFVPMPAVNAAAGAVTAPENKSFAEARGGSYTPFQEGDVLFAKITPCMENGKAAIATGLVNGLGFGSTEFHVLRANGGVLPEYVHRFIRQESFRAEAKAHMSGNVGQQRVPVPFMRDALIPMPPLAEQTRIAAKVEELLARVNAARDRLVKVPEVIKRFRQSVLAAACSGRLTENWTDEHPGAAIVSTAVAGQEPKPRKRGRTGRLWGAGVVPPLTDDERGSIPETWTWSKVAALGEAPEDAVQVGPMSMRSRDFADTGVPVLNVGCVQWGLFDESKLDYLPPEIATRFERYRIAEGDILFTRSGTVGRCAIATIDQDGYLMTFHLLRMRPDSRKVVTKYLYCAFRGAPNISRQTQEAAIGSTRAGFNTKLLAGLDVPLPSISEQQEIVRRVEALFGLADAIEKRVATATEHAGRLTQAILAKAFRGELVPTEAELARREGRNYEPASVLLGRIRRERAKEEAAKPKRRGGRRRSR